MVQYYKTRILRIRCVAWQNQSSTLFNFLNNWVCLPLVFIHFGIPYVNWVFDVSNKYFLGILVFLLGIFVMLKLYLAFDILNVLLLL